MVIKNSSLVIGDIIRRNAFILSLFEESENKSIIIDCTGLISNFLDITKINLPNDKIKIGLNKSIFCEVISSLLNLDSHSKLHLKSSISKLADEELRINKIIEKIASTSNPFIHSPIDVIYLESLMYELYELKELDDCLDNNAKTIKDYLSEEKLLIDLSNIFSTKTRKALCLLILYEFIFKRNDYTELYIYIEGPEGTCLAATKHIEDILLELKDRLMLNDVALILTSSYEELSNRLISRFENIYFIHSDKVFKMNGLEAIEKKYPASFKDLPYIKLNENFEKIFLIEKSYAMHKDYRSQSILELLYGDLSDLIADIILSMEKNMISRKEFKNLALSLGYFKDSEELLNKMLSEDLIEERIIGGVKKLTASSKGLFLAKAHKQR
jgi:hypothetical protein